MFSFARIFSTSSLTSLLFASHSFAAPYYIEYTGTISAVETAVDAVIPAGFPQAGEVYRVIYVLDNDGASNASQSWVKANIEALILRFNNAEDGALIIDVPNIRAQFGLGSSLTATGNITTDASGAVSGMFSYVQSFIFSDDRSLDWNQAFGWMPADNTLALFLSENNQGGTAETRVIDATSGTNPAIPSFTVREDPRSISTPASWSNPVSASCAGGVLATQAEVDAIATNVCAHITGNLTVDGADITDLSPLRIIRTIDGELTLGALPRVSSYQGLAGLRTVNGVDVNPDGDFESNYTDLDDDGDGVADKVELANGTDPLDSGDFASVEAKIPSGLLLRAFESEAALNRPGYEAIENGVPATLRVDAAGEISEHVRLRPSRL